MGAPTKYKPSIRTVAQYCPRFVLACPRQQPRKKATLSRARPPISSLHQFQLCHSNSFASKSASAITATLIAPQNLNRLFSITYALFLIHNFVYPLYFLTAAHSLPKTPGGGGLHLLKKFSQVARIFQHPQILRDISSCHSRRLDAPPSLPRPIPNSRQNPARATMMLNCLALLEEPAHGRF